MNFKRLTDPSLQQADWEALRTLYQSSFPLHEQRTDTSQRLALTDSDFHCLSISRDAEFVGLLCYWQWQDYRYIEHFAINPQLRGQNLGTIVLQEFCRLSPAEIILEIDPLTDDITKKRLRFYQRLGFVTNTYQHIHPAYQKQCHPHPLLILSFPTELSPAMYQDFNNYLNNRVMLYREH